MFLHRIVDLLVDGFINKSIFFNIQLSFLDSFHVLLSVLDLQVPLPENFSVLFDSIQRLVWQVRREAIEVLPTELLIQPDKLEELLLTPVGEPGCNESFPLCLVFPGELRRRRLVHLEVLFRVCLVYCPLRLLLL